MQEVRVFWNLLHKTRATLGIFYRHVIVARVQSHSRHFDMVLPRAIYRIRRESPSKPVSHAGTALGRARKGERFRCLLDARMSVVVSLPACYTSRPAYCCVVSQRFACERPCPRCTSRQSLPATSVSMRKSPQPAPDPLTAHIPLHLHIPPDQLQTHKPI